MKATSVLVCAKAPLRLMPPEAMRWVEWFLFEWLEGMDPEHNGRWHRLWRRLYRSGASRPSLQMWIDVERDRPFHARWMAIEQRIFANQDGFYSLAGFRWWLKSGAAFGTYSLHEGRMVFVPSSLSWEDCSDDEMREFSDNAIVFLRTPYALATLWPAVKERDRDAMLEAQIANPKQENTQ